MPNLIPDESIPDELIPMIPHLANKDIAIEHEPMYTLADMLSIKKITALRELWKLYGVTESLKASKMDIIPILAGKMADIERLKMHLQILGQQEWDFFRKAAMAEHLIDEEVDFRVYLRLNLIGLIGVYHFNSHHYYVVPAEIKQMYGILETEGFPAEKEHADLLNGYAIAATNLYGVISQDDLVEIFNSQNERKTNIDEMFGILLLFVALEYGYVFWEDYIVCDEFGDDDYKDVEYCAKTAASKPRYLPEREEFLKFSDWNYIERTPPLDKLRYYLSREVTNDESVTDGIVRDMYFLARRNAQPQEFFALFEEKELDLDTGKIKTLVDLIVELANNTRLWIYNGHTPMELSDGEAESLGSSRTGPIRVVKVGRNELCPCGSGKKYKKCCGADEG